MRLTSLGTSRTAAAVEHAFANWGVIPLWLGRVPDSLWPDLRVFEGAVKLTAVGALVGKMNALAR